MSGHQWDGSRQLSKVQPAGEHRYQVESISDEPVVAHLIDHKLGTPERPCSCCGKPFEQTQRRRRLCRPCFTKY